MKTGTPMTLNEAIRNGLDEAKVSALADGIPLLNHRTSNIIEAHVRDFFAQKFAIAFLQGDVAQVAQFEKLWQSIITKETK